MVHGISPSALHCLFINAHVISLHFGGVAGGDVGDGGVAGGDVGEGGVAGGDRGDGEAHVKSPSQPLHSPHKGSTVVHGISPSALHCLFINAHVISLHFGGVAGGDVGDGGVAGGDGGDVG